ncbi:MAG: hypothetical protein A4E29_01566 [Methanomassiliicoccales archaeon PtaB.Bin134]|nr:MAG: hypothetical protein A4E29_01566 [Methanomassiliicoccales archaeon PtaB.Bin134]
MGIAICALLIVTLFLKVLLLTSRVKMPRLNLALNVAIVPLLVLFLLNLVLELM